MRTVLAVATLLATTASAALAQSIQGVWKAVEVDVDSGPNSGRHTSDVQPSLLIFTAHHYSLMAVTGFAARPKLSDKPTAEERGKVYGPFVANAGTYTLKDSLMTYTPLVAKNPAVMAGRTDSVTVRIVADSLWLNRGHLKLVRVE